MTSLSIFTSMTKQEERKDQKELVGKAGIKHQNNMHCSCCCDEGKRQTAHGGAKARVVVSANNTPDPGFCSLPPQPPLLLLLLDSPRVG